jgi:hypothetical protein
MDLCGHRRLLALLYLNVSAFICGSILVLGGSAFLSAGMQDQDVPHRPVDGHQHIGSGSDFFDTLRQPATLSAA